MDKRLVDGYLSKTAELLDAIEGKVRHVRDPDFWGKPYGTPITPGMKPTGKKPSKPTVRVQSGPLTRSFAGITGKKMPPTQDHVLAVWEGILGTVYARDPDTGEEKYFDYNWGAAAHFAKVEDSADVRIGKKRGRGFGVYVLPTQKRPHTTIGTYTPQIVDLDDDQFDSLRTSDLDVTKWSITKDHKLTVWSAEGKDDLLESLDWRIEDREKDLKNPPKWYDAEIAAEDRKEVAALKRLRRTVAKINGK